MNTSEFSIIIQGALNPITIKRIPKLKQFGKIILSFWDTDDTSLLDDADLTDVVLLANSKFYEDTTCNNFNMWFQFKSTYEGLLKAHTPYSIKLRSDNYVSNLLPFMESAISHSEKLTCSNLYFRPDNVMKFHPSDQLLSGSTELMRRIFELALWRLENQSLRIRSAFNDQRWTNNDFFTFKDYSEEITSNASAKMAPGMGTAPEVLLGTSVLAAKNIAQDLSKSKELMKENFHIVRLEECGIYLGKDGTNRIPHLGPEIHNIMEI